MNQVGKKTPIFLRFSTVAGERGANDCDRDPRGFSIKHYTEEGNYDMVGNNTPVFFIKDPIKFPDFIHSQKRNPVNNLKDPNSAFDFWSYSPEALHQVTILMSNRGTPYGYRHMNGYSSHTFRWVNDKNEVHYVKYHYKTAQGIKNFTAAEAQAMGVKNSEFSTYDLYDEISKGNHPSWNWFVQAMPEKDAAKYRFDVFDITKVWSHKDYPLIPVGKITLNRNPTNYHAETEQVAYAPSHLVPGIEPSMDKMLQGRLLNYPDTHRHRLGKNYEQIPINCPYRATMGNYNQRDGTMVVNGGGAQFPTNYEPNSAGGPVEDKSYAWSKQTVSGDIARYPHQHPNTNFEQPRELFNRVFSEQDRVDVINNISGPLSQCRQDIKDRYCALLMKVDTRYGTEVAKKVGAKLQ
jgi:catalase